MRHFSSPLVVLACFAASACTDQSSTIWISQVNAPSFEDGVCTSSGTTIQSSSWSPTGSNSYGQFLTILNGVRSNASDIANDSAWVQLQGIEVTLLDANGGTIDVGGANPYSLPLGGTIPSAGSATDLGEASVKAVIIPASYGPALLGIEGGFVIASIIPFGETLGGLDVEGPPFDLPVLITASSCTTPVCEDDASAVDFCSGGQDGACPVISDSDPACAD